MKLRVLDLFSGIGGFSLGLERTGGFETVAFCEIEEFPRKVLNKHWPHVPVYEDVRTLDPARLGRIDLVCGGYPCQPFSHAGKRLGAEDDRHLWPEMRRLVEALRPAWVIGENVAGHVSMGLDDVLSDLGTLGYACQALVIPACAVNAPHRRDRVWIVANDDGARLQAPWPKKPTAGFEQHGKLGCNLVAHASDMQRDGGNDNARELMGSEQVSEPGNDGWPADVADTTDTGFPQRRRSKRETRAKEAGAGLVAQFERCGQDVADANGDDAQGFVSERPDAEGWAGPFGRQARSCSDGLRWWATEPAVGRVAHGVSRRVDRLKALGNAVVPQIPELIGHAILQSMEAA